jgi:hypothetical protein
VLFDSREKDSPSDVSDGEFPTDDEIIRLENAAKYYKSAVRSAY